MSLLARVLGKGEVSLSDNFFEVGGDSLLAVDLLQQVSRAQQLASLVHQELHFRQASPNPIAYDQHHRPGRTNVP